MGVTYLKEIIVTTLSYTCLAFMSMPTAILYAYLVENRGFPNHATLFILLAAIVPSGVFLQPRVEKWIRFFIPRLRTHE